ncbi:Ubiquitin-associated domain-containing protein 2 [Triticum urartu]|uniref:Ubiquitin-associated domain-containing protein 2 n=1 Tax=Triticum urartu TaxID=4572 RepID=M7ZVP3_TRIUA|nr:Ubiquitin-associated domain-containing protein 2 [Triticum urartu]
MGTATRTEGWRSGAVDGKEVAGEVAVLLDDDERRRPVHARPGEKWIWENLYENLRIWRVIASLFAFSSSPELIFGVALLYYFRVFERQIGSNKYAVFIVFSMTVSVLLQILALGYLKDPSFNPLTSGPYGLIFASYVPFFFDIPISTKFRIFGLQLCDKSFVYLAGLQLLFSSGRRSVIPGLSGILAGLLYRLNIFGIRRLKGTHTTTPDPTESSIATLVSMGFDPASAIQALALTNNDVNLASNILLEAQST